MIALVDAIDDVFSIDVQSEAELKEAGLIQMIGKEIDDVYTERVKALEINPDCNKKDLKIVFTPLHGTANMPVRRVLTECEYEQLHVVEDYKESIHTDLTNDSTTAIDLPNSNVLKYTLADGSWFGLGPSGTEPKAKVYIGVIADVIDAADAQVAKIKENVLAHVNEIIS